MEIKWNRSLSFRGSSQKQSSKSVVIGDIFHVYEASALHTISLMLLPINVFNSFLRDSFEMTTGEHYQLTLYMWMMNKSCIEFFVQKLNHNYTPFVSFLFEFSIFCSSTLLANKGSSRGSNPCRMGSSGSKEQLSSRTTLVKSSPCRSWWRFRMGRVVDMSRCKGPKYIILCIMISISNIQNTSTLT